MATKKATNTTAPKTAPKSDDVAKSVIAGICAELKIDPRVARRRLRASGMSAPYEDVDAVRKVLTKPAEPIGSAKAT